MLDSIVVEVSIVEFVIFEGSIKLLRILDPNVYAVIIFELEIFVLNDVKPVRLLFVTFESLIDEPVMFAINVFEFNINETYFYLCIQVVFILLTKGQ